MDRSFLPPKGLQDEREYQEAMKGAERRRMRWEAAVALMAAWRSGNARYHGYADVSPDMAAEWALDDTDALLAAFEASEEKP